MRPEDFYAHVHETIFAVLSICLIAASRSTRSRSRSAAHARPARESRRPLVLEFADGHRTDRGVGEILRERSCARSPTLRSLIHAGTQISQLGYEAEEDVDAALDRSEQSCTRSASAPERCLYRGQQPHEGCLRAYDRTLPCARRSHGRDLRFPRHRRHDHRLPAGQLRNRCGAPGMGKTSFALNMPPWQRRAKRKPGRVLLARNVEQRVDPASDLLRSAAFDARSASRQHQVASVGRYLARDGQPQRAADLSR